ncbi:YjbF family lipoprotein [Gemmobacter denitrificans]|uniref:YjbF family lipoprotein n=1 Tax=Gemmobacter denitrificans TaxID=3123040 RepID=A0ABU8BVF9_9RHOB
MGGLRSAQAFGKALWPGKAAGVAPAPSRADLEAFKAPIILVEQAGTDARLYLVPVSNAGGVEVWSTSDQRTMTFRNGVLAETRGMGADLMQSATPNLAQLRAGAGNHVRTYDILDGGDQMVRSRYDCALTVAGVETITVVGRQHATRHVIETCRAESHEFTNEYWFESSGKLRKSKELAGPRVGAVTVSRVIDN